MPIQAQSGRIVLELATGRLEYRVDEVLNGLTGMHVRARDQQRSKVDRGDVAFQHAVGEEQQPITRLKRQRLHPILVAAHNPERRIGLQDHRLHSAAAQPQRRRMTGVDDGCDLVPQIDARNLPGDEPAPAGEVPKPGICQTCLITEPGSGSTRVAQRPDEHGGEDRGTAS
jgi:hypothetical protein